MGGDGTADGRMGGDGPPWPRSSPHRADPARGGPSAAMEDGRMGGRCRGHAATGSRRRADGRPQMAAAGGARRSRDGRTVRDKQTEGRADGGGDGPRRL